MTGSNPGHQCMSLVGPTASGKTDLALQFAEKHGAEIINLDAMQIFRGLDIGTAKPSKEEQARVPHHLFDIRDAHEPLGSGYYATLAKDTAEGILGRNKIPLFVGGTGFYLRCLRQGLSPIPEISSSIRKILSERLDVEGLGSLRAELEDKDPTWAARIHPHDKQRTLRGLEVLEGTGRTLSYFQELPREGALPFPLSVAYLDPGAEVLKARIEERASVMLEAGLIAEVSGLLEGGLSEDAHGFRAPGYREVLEYLAGTIKREELLALVIRSHKAYARRQRTFFKGEEERIDVVDLEEFEKTTLRDP